MENKLQQLTQKLYDEGLEKGRAEADRLVAEAKTNAAKIVKEARAQAEKIVAEGQHQGRGCGEEHDDRNFARGQAGPSKIKAEIAR